MFTPCKIKGKTAEHVSSFIKSNKPSLWLRYDIRYYCFLLPSWLEDWKSRDVWEAHLSHTVCVSQAICYWKNVSKWNNISIMHIDMSVIKYLNPIEDNATAILEDKIIVPSQKLLLHIYLNFPRHCMSDTFRSGIKQFSIWQLAHTESVLCSTE